MLNILIFSIGIMYTPGPVNILSFNNGLQKNMATQFMFSMGVGCALLFYLLLVGYAGSSVIDESMLPYIGLLGGAFILFLAGKVILSEVNMHGAEKCSLNLTFKDGLLMQLLNPKSFLVVLPVATVQFPAAGIEGVDIAVWSLLLALFGFGAPTLYAMVGAMVGHRLNRSGYFKCFNMLMGLMLIFVACDIVYHQTYLPLIK
ncbi:LysE family translocator [Pseudodesulfovibrio piezophilus]|uniref:Lysine exporter protein (LYSE/YGGA) n=1 Tax=Pseudodesulfovibrio piezophilus (strain DSM 21447 / JCM 15486 / C1TLV30) TaxID=1322246 RepID=M1WK83_PSEP2|nr:LysE family transporter [Pseudodesulfovibrio piezophilus]CCH49151.1 conserved membrane protein of unknown function [Pseudodesulfovibrio piezophilus C1TLV30]